jgi:hypothetical protein
MIIFVKEEVMVKNIEYPDYVDYYYFTKGSNVIKLERKNDSDIIYSKYIQFNNPREALECFEDKCWIRDKK